MMDAPSSLALLLLVVPSLAVIRELLLVNQPMSWSDAQSYCRGKLLDLVTVANQDDWARVSGMVADSAAGEAWIGLYDDVYGWRRSLDNTPVYPGGDTSLATWFPLNIDNAYGDEYCLVFSGGEFKDERCQKGSYLICYNEPSNTYPSISSAVGWSEGLRRCRQTYTDLASVKNQADVDTIRTNYPGPGWWWVGFSRTNWTWSDQSNSSFWAWSQGQPTAGLRNCTYTDSSGWANDDCWTARPFICSTPIHKVIKVVLKSDGATDPNDHHILAALLNQRKTLLREQDIDQEVELKWRADPRGVVFNKTEL